VNKTIFIFFFALLARIACAVLFSWTNDHPFITGDSSGYLAIAENIARHSTYSETGNLRTPLYPLLLAPFFFFNLSHFTMIFAQGILGAITAVFIYRFGKKLFPEKIALFSALAFSADLVSIFYANVFLTEILFTFMFLPAIFFCLLYFKKQKTRYFLASGALLGLASLARPIGLALFMLLPLCALIAHWPRIIIIWRPTLVAAVVFFIVISPWLFYIYTNFSTLQFSSIYNYDWVFNKADNFHRWLYPDRPTIFDKGIARDLLDQSAGHVIPNEVVDVAKKFISDHKIQYAAFHLLYAPRLFLHDGYTDSLETLANIDFAFDNVSLYNSFVQLDFEKLKARIAEHPIIILSLIPKTFLLAIAAMAFLNLILILKYNRNSLSVKISLFLTILLVFYTLLVSPVGYSRFRFVINPILFLLAIESITIVIRRIWRQRPALH